MSKHLYKQYIRLVNKWPKDQFKNPDRDLSSFLTKEIERQFSPTSTITIESGLCERRLQALEDLYNNKISKQYPHKYKSGVFGLTLQQLQEVSTEENRKHLGLTTNNSLFRKAWSIIFAEKKKN